MAKRYFWFITYEYFIKHLQGTKEKWFYEVFKFHLDIKSFQWFYFWEKRNMVSEKIIAVSKRLGRFKEEFLGEANEDYDHYFEQEHELFT